MSVSYMTHPLIKHKITLLRKTTTGTGEFRKGFIDAGGSQDYTNDHITD